MAIEGSYVNKCVVCGGWVDLTEEGNYPSHYHIACAEKAKEEVVVWRGKALQAEEEDLSWVHDNSELTGHYLGVAFEDKLGFFSATIVVHGVESEGEGATAVEALDSAYIDLQQETLHITSEVWQLGQGV